MSSRRNAAPRRTRIVLARRIGVPLAAVAAVVLALAATAAFAGCGAARSTRHLTDDGDDGSTFTSNGDSGSGSQAPAFTGDCPDGLRSIAVTPASTTLVVTYPQKPPPVTFAAQGTYADGSTMDVTDCAAWTVTPGGVATLTAGTLTPASAGAFTVTASNGAISASVTAIVKLTGTANPSGVDTTKLDGSPAGAAPEIAYPVDGALFPYHLGDLAFQVTPGAAGQTLGRIAFEGDAIDLKVYAPCVPIPSATVSGACSIALPPDLEADLAGVSAAPTLTETVRLASASGSSLGESAPIDARWLDTPLSGTIYYWSTPPMAQSGASEIVRMNLDAPGTPPEVYLTNLDDQAYAPPLSGGWACVGCHAISQDGTKMGITIGGSSIQANGDGTGSLFALLDIASRTPIAMRVTDDGGQQLSTTGFAELTTFSPDGSNMVQELQGQLFLRAADATLASQGPLFPSMTEKLTQPMWSPKGDQLAFASWVPTLNIPHAYDSKDLNGNETPGAQIWTVPVTGTTFGAPALLVPRVTNATEYYPALSDDSAFVVFNESSCSGPASPGADGYGTSPCDGYDDPSARLRLVAATGGTPVELDRASGRTSGWPTSDTWTNSWPRVAPSHSSFQGKTLYWIAFSSRRAYGDTLAGSASGSTPPQIWFAAVAIDPSGQPTGDPSFAPVWLPQQNSATPEILPDGGRAQTLGGNGTPTGNHVPQWVVKYVQYVPPIPR